MGEGRGRGEEGPGGLSQALPGDLQTENESKTKKNRKINAKRRGASVRTLKARWRAGGRLVDRDGVGGGADARRHGQRQDLQSEEGRRGRGEEQWASELHGRCHEAKGSVRFLSRDGLRALTPLDRHSLSLSLSLYPLPSAPPSYWTLPWSVTAALVVARFHPPRPPPPPPRHFP